MRLERVKPGVPVEDREDAVLFHRVKTAVIARLGDQTVDTALLDAVIQRVLAALPRS